MNNKEVFDLKIGDSISFPDVYSHEDKIFKVYQIKETTEETLYLDMYDQSKQIEQSRGRVREIGLVFFHAEENHGCQIWDFKVRDGIDDTKVYRKYLFTKDRIKESLKQGLFEIMESFPFTIDRIIKQPD